MRRSFIQLAAVLFLLRGGTSLAAPGPQGDRERTLYALGYLSTRGLANVHLSETERALFLRGALEASHGHSHSYLIGKVQQADPVLLRIKSRWNRRFLEEAARHPGAERFPSGLIFTQVKAGTGESPRPTDAIILQFRGLLSDGSEFESSYRRGENVGFAMNGVIPCWSEALSKMKVGGSAKMVCPPEIAYGANGYVPRIPGGEILQFEVTLVAVEHPQPAPDGGNPNGQSPPTEWFTHRPPPPPEQAGTADAGS